MRRARRMPVTGGSSSSCQPTGSDGSPSDAVRAVFWLVDRVPSSLSAIEPGRNPEQVPCMTRAGPLSMRRRISGKSSTQRK